MAQVPQLLQDMNSDSVSDPAPADRGGNGEEPRAESEDGSNSDTDDSQSEDEDKHKGTVIRPRDESPTARKVRLLLRTAKLSVTLYWKIQSVSPKTYKIHIVQS